MKKGILSVLMLLAGTVVFAQRPSLPVTSAEFAPGTVRRQARAEERAERNARFIARQDSLVQSRNFQFLPVSVLEVPGGGEQTINNIYYYLAVFPDHIEVHLPTLRGYLNPYVEVLNFEDPVGLEYFVQCGRRGGECLHIRHQPFHGYGRGDHDDADSAEYHQVRGVAGGQ